MGQYKTWANLMGKPLFHSNKITVNLVTQLLFVECLQCLEECWHGSDV